MCRLSKHIHSFNSILQMQAILSNESHIKGNKGKQNRLNDIQNRFWYTGTHKKDAINLWLNEADWKTILWSAGSKHDIPLGNHRCHVHWVMRKGNIQLAICTQFTSICVWMSAYDTGTLQILGRPHCCWTFFLMEDIGDNVKPHFANIPTAWLCCKWVGVRSWNVCSHNQQYHLLKTSGTL